jgi:hypothetical protein
MKYAIFINDLEIHISFTLESEDSIEAIKEHIKYEIENGLDNGYIESYPFFKAHWHIVKP